MAYKNTDTRESAKSALYNWSYFSSAIQKLSPIKGQTTNISVHNIAPKEEVDWVKAVVGIGKGAQGIYKAFRGASYTEAGEYFRTHSLKDYQKAVKDNNVPFSHNPVARGVLNEMTGSMVSKIADQEFQNRINNGEFINKTPEEIDAAFLEHKRNAFKDTKDDYAITHPNDPFFNQGFWDKSDASRIDAFLKNDEVTSKYNLEKFLTSVQAELDHAIEAGRPLEDILAITMKANKIGGDYMSYADQMNLVKGSIEKMAKMGGHIPDIEKYRKMVNPNTGKTIEDELGKGFFDTCVATSRGLEIKSNAVEDFNLRDKITRAVIAGDLTTIDNEIAVEFAKSGGVKTERVTYLEQERRNCLMRQESIAKEAILKNSGELTQEESLTTSMLYLSRMIGGERGLKLNSQPFSSTNERAVDMVFNQMTRPEGFRGIHLTEEDILDMASNPSDTYNPAKKYIQNMQKRSMDICTDLEDKIAKGDIITEIPEELTKTLKFMDIKPSAFSESTTGADPKLQAMYTVFKDNGNIGVIQFLKGYKVWNKDMDETDRTKATKRYLTSSPEGMKLTDPSAIVHYQYALGAHVKGNGGELTKDTMTLAKDTMLRNGHVWRGSFIPENWMEETLGNKYRSISPSLLLGLDTLDLSGVTSGTKAFRDQRDKITVSGLLKDRFDAMGLEKKGFKLEDLNATFNSEGLTIWSQAQPLFVITKNDIRDRAENLRNFLEAYGKQLNEEEVKRTEGYGTRYETASAD